jgi:hypothetical protein
MAAPRKCTLLDLVWTIGDGATSDAEVVATVAYLINSGKVLLCGTFAGAKIDLSVPTSAAFPSPLVSLGSLRKITHAVPS